MYIHKSNHKNWPFCFLVPLALEFLCLAVIVHNSCYFQYNKYIFCILGLFSLLHQSLWFFSCTNTSAFETVSFKFIGYRNSLQVDVLLRNFNQKIYYVFSLNLFVILIGKPWNKNLDLKDIAVHSFLKQLAKQIIWHKCIWYL